MKRPILLRRTTALLLVVSAAVMLRTPTTPALPAAPAGAADPDGGAPGPAQLLLVEQTAWVAPEGELLLRLRPESASPGATLEVTLHDRVTARGQFTDGLSGGSLGTELSRACGTVLDGAVAGLTRCSVPLDRATRDGEGAVVITLPIRSGDDGPAGRITVGAQGVYPVLVRMLDSSGEEQTRLVTHLLRLPDPTDDSPPLDFSLALTLDAPVGLQPDGSTQLPEEELDRLRELLEALIRHAGVPVVVSATPETLETLYALGGEGRRLVDRWAATQGSAQVIARPYVDLDPGAWWNADLDAELADQFETGRTAVMRLLGSNPDNRSWLVSETTDPSTLERLVTRGVQGVSIPEELLDPLDENLFEIALDQPFLLDWGEGRTLPAVADDAGLRAHVDATGDSRLDAHHLLADLAVLYFQRPGVSRGISVALPTPTHPALLETLLAGLDGDSVVHAASLPDLFDRASLARLGGTDTQDGPPLVHAYTYAPPPGLDDYPARLRTAQAAQRTYWSLVPGARAAEEGREEDLIRVSGSRSLTLDEQDRYLSAPATSVAEVTAAIVVPAQPAVTLTAREGTIPVRLENDYGRPVAVSVMLRSDKLEFPEGDTIAVTLNPGETRLEVDVRTRASGTFPVDVVVTSPDGSLRIDEGRFTLRSTAIPGIGLVLSAIAFLFLLVWWGRHWRTARRARRLVPHEPDPAVEP